MDAPRENGHAGAQGVWMRLDYDPAMGTLRISGAIPSVEVARHMLEQAAWEYEAQWRQQRAAAFAEQLAQNRKLQALSETVMGKR